MTPPAPRAPDPLRTIVSEGWHDRRVAHWLDCGHIVPLELGMRYGKRRRCYQCTRMDGVRQSLEHIAAMIPRACDEIAAGRLSDAYHVINGAPSLERWLREAIEAEDASSQEEPGSTAARPGS